MEPNFGVEPVHTILLGQFLVQTHIFGSKLTLNLLIQSSPDVAAFRLAKMSVVKNIFVSFTHSQLVI